MTWSQWTALTVVCMGGGSSLVFAAMAVSAWIRKLRRIRRRERAAWVAQTAARVKRAERLRTEIAATPVTPTTKELPRAASPTFSGHQLIVAEGVRMFIVATLCTSRGYCPGTEEVAEHLMAIYRGVRGNRADQQWVTHSELELMLRRTATWSQAALDRMNADAGQGGA